MARNRGPVVRSDEDIAIGIRDFDQTAIGDPMHDLIREAADRSWNHPAGEWVARAGLFVLPENKIYLLSWQKRSDTMVYLSGTPHDMNGDDADRVMTGTPRQWMPPVMRDGRTHCGAAA